MTLAHSYQVASRRSHQGTELGVVDSTKTDLHRVSDQPIEEMDIMNFMECIGA